MSTPLHLASSSGFLEIAQVLFERGADVNAQDRNKWTPLHLALKGGHVEFARVLIEHGADADVWKEYQSTRLHFASLEGDVGFARVLLDHHSANVNARDFWGLTPLQHARRRGFHDIAYILLVRGALDNSA
jgi:ankyrin repeat protein